MVSWMVENIARSQKSAIDVAIVIKRGRCVGTVN